MMGKTKSRKMTLVGVLSTYEEQALCEYIVDMAECALPLTPRQLKLKIGQMTQ